MPAKKQQKKQKPKTTAAQVQQKKQALGRKKRISRVKQAKQAKAQGGKSIVYPLLPYQWAKGQSGNPKGRPKKGVTISDLVRKIGAERLAIHDEAGRKHHMDRMELMIRQAFRQAAAGDTAAREFIANRRDGTVKQIIENIERSVDIGFE